MKHAPPATTDLQDLVDAVRTALVAAEKDGPDATTVAALRRCSDWLTQQANGDTELAGAYDGFIDYTLDDEAFGSHFRQFDIRVFYSWEDYDRADEPFAQWGANVERCEVLEVRYFDEDGNELSADEYHHDEALRLVESHHDQVTEACTEDGYRQGVGVCHPLYSASLGGPPAAAEVVRRMAPSTRVRQTQRDQRDFG